VLWYALVAAAGAAFAYLLTPGIRILAIKVGAIKHPGRDRDVHHDPTPTLGGVAIYLAFVFALLSAAVIPALRPAFRFTDIFGLMAGGLVALAVGVVDDRTELSAAAKTAGSIVAAGVMYQLGLRMSFFWLPGIGVLSLSPELSALLTFAWIWLLMQAVNVSDGLDGLAAGLTAIGGSAFFLYSLRLESQGLLGPHPLAPLAAAALVGVCIGFLRFNFNPARIFMGDSGAYVLGFFLAGATISAVGRSTTPGAEGGRLALPLVFTPIVFLALPVTDTLFAYVRRVARGQPFYKADKEHIHHRLMRLGHSHRQAVLVMYGWALLLAGGLIVAGVMPWGRFLLMFAVAVGTVAILTMAPKLR
jgi:UDP-GlcNAc:undecaprenyl-phosphate GlcNAc-1-phosphate transferase